MSWTLAVGACGPAFEEELNEALEAPATEEPSTDEALPEEGGEVSQATHGGSLGSRLGNSLAVFNSCVANNEWRTTCGGGSPSRDMSYTWTVPVTGDYVITTGGSSYDTVLEVRRTADTAVVYACNDDRTDEVLTSHVVLRDQPKGRNLFIIIDAYDGDCGQGHLNIRGL